MSSGSEHAFPAGKHVLVSALSDNVVLRVSSATEFADTIHGTRSHLGQVSAMNVLVIDDLGAARQLVDRLWLVGAIPLVRKVDSTVSPGGLNALVRYPSLVVQYLSKLRRGKMLV